MPGRIVSHYEILDKLGEGGNGAVWKARDTRLNRLVAIKFLCADKMANPERRRRFAQEARSASALNHPNIVTIYDIAAADGIDFIVMEHVAGTTLDRRIPRHGMRLGELLDTAIQIADALGKAHAAGIVHRDLKPGNIMVTHEGRVKLLDFGLAKLVETGPGLSEDDPTRTVKAVTEDGAIVGTIAYMSPEQAQGQPVDGRSDIFSFGSVLYEMATGIPAFGGDSRLGTLSAILRDNPKAPSAVAGEIPRDLEKIILRCLRKDPARRCQTMLDLKVALLEIQEESESGSLEAAAKPVRKPGWRPTVFGAIAALVVAAAAAWWVWMRPAGKAREAPRLVQLTAYAGSERQPTFSPDGSQVAFSWNGEKQDNFDIYVKLVDGGAPLRLTTNPAPDTSPAWSPDGRWIAFVREGAVYLIPPIGGNERKLVDSEVTSVAWMPDSQSVVVSARRKTAEGWAIFQVPLGSGEMRPITTPPIFGNALGGDRVPAVSPDGQRVAFDREIDSGDIYVTGFNGGEARRLTKDKRFVLGMTWVDNREIVFSSDRLGGRTLWRIQADGNAPPQPVLGVQGEAQFPAVAQPIRGPARLAYEQQLLDFNIWREEISAKGDGSVRVVTPAAPVIASTRVDWTPQFSPDGRRIAFESNRSGYREIWVAASDGSNQVQLTAFKSARAGSPRWSPDGQRIAFDSLAAGNNDIYWIGADGSAAQRLTTEPSNEGRPSWSQDGRWIYFRSDRSGTPQIWKMPAAEPHQPAVQMTRNGGFEAFESLDGKLLYFTNLSGGLWSIPVEGGQETPVLDGVRSGLWGVARNGIYFVTVDQAPATIQLFSFETRKVSRVGEISKALSSNSGAFTVTRDGRWIAWAQADRVEADLMMVENFR